MTKVKPIRMRAGARIFFFTYRAATRHLLALGHRRIVLIAREERRKPAPGLVERAFLEELAACSGLTSGYHLPDWGDRWQLPQGCKF